MTTETEAPKSLHSSSSAAVVGVMPTRLVLKTQSLDSDSGNRSCRHFVRQRDVALEVSLKVLNVVLFFESLINCLLEIE